MKASIEALCAVVAFKNLKRWDYYACVRHVTKHSQKALFYFKSLIKFKKQRINKQLSANLVICTQQTVELMTSLQYVISQINKFKQILY
jgi:hypothetical protein